MRSFSNITLEFRAVDGTNGSNLSKVVHSTFSGCAMLILLEN